MNILLFSGSLRKESLNKKLVAVAHKTVSQMPGHKVEVVDLQALYIPVYDGDIETAGFPEGVKKLGEAVKKADALIISSPEYNGSIAGSLKNTVDWLSRLKPVPLEKKSILFMGASPGDFGAARALGVVKTPFERLGSYAYPEVFPLPKADQAFNADGDLKEDSSTQKLKKLIGGFLEFAEKLK